MFYVKTKSSDGKETKIAITPDNTYTTCSKCGKEIKVDISDAFYDCPGFDMYGFGCICKDCYKEKYKMDCMGNLFCE